MLQNFSLTHGILLCPSLHCVSTDLIPGEQAVMPKVYLKEADNPSRTEVSVESVEDLAVKDFRETASEKLDIPLDELCECCLESLENVICYIMYVCLDLPAEGQIVS